MCDQKKQIHYALGLAVVLGLLTGWFDYAWLLKIAHVVEEGFLRLLKLISLPILFFALVSTLSNLDHWQELAVLGRRILRYTLLTTYLATLVGLGFFLYFKPIAHVVEDHSAGLPGVAQQSYWEFLWKIIPDNLLKAFVENNVLGVAFIGMVLGTAILHLEPRHKAVCQDLFASIFAAILKLAGVLIRLMPIGIWAFVALLVESSKHQPEQLKELGLYALCVIGANAVQGFLVLPGLLAFKGHSPLRILKGVFPALVTAFFTKSSSATMPITLGCLHKNLNIDSKTANTVVPLCTIVNMNGCAAFILITVLFVSMSHGISFSLGEMMLWTIMATIAAIGNAGVPMGCYFLASAFLLNMNVPMTLMAWIVPLYMVIDMVETALNVWSDACITVIVAKEKEASILNT